MTDMLSKPELAGPYLVTAIKLWKNSPAVQAQFDGNEQDFNAWCEGAVKLKGFDGAEAALQALEYETPEAAAAIKAEVSWKTNAAIREEFSGNYDTYLGYCKGAATGRVRAFGG